MKFDGNGATAVAMDDQTFKNGETKALSKNTFVLADNEFKGWNDKADGTGTAYNDEAQFTAPNKTETLTLYAQWTSDVYTVKIAEDIQHGTATGEGGGTPFSESQKQPFKLPGKPDAFTPPENKSFDGWTRPGNDKIYAVGEELNLNADTMLTAHYSGGCYVATAVYGSYDCPEVWTLRRFRDKVLAKTWYGRLFIRLYYALSPTAARSGSRASGAENWITWCPTFKRKALNLRSIKI